MASAGNVIQILRALWPYLRPYRRMLLLALAAMAGETVTALLAPWPLKFVFDRILLVLRAATTRSGLPSRQAHLHAHFLHSPA